MASAQRHKWLEYGIIGLVVVGAVLLFAHSSAPSKGAAKTKAPKPGYSESFLQSIAQIQGQETAAALQTRAQTVNAAYSYGAVVNNDNAQVRQAQIQGTTAVKLGGIAQQIASSQDSAQEAIARLEAQAQEALGSDAESAQNTQSTWGGIGSIFGSLIGGLGSIFGFNPSSVFTPQGPSAWDMPGAYNFPSVVNVPQSAYGAYG